MTDPGPTGFRPTAHPLYSGDVDVPPAPTADGTVLAGLLDRALRMADSASVPQALVDLAVHAWMEGHVDGEDRCGGCDGGCGFPRGIARPELIAEACFPGHRPGAIPGLKAPGPVPPFPDPADPVLAAIVIGALGMLREGRPSDRVLPMVAARAWAEGHLEGEERCPGCDWRGGLARGADRDAVARGDDEVAG